MALSKNKIKYIQSLSNKKGRSVENTFLAEGNKLVAELLPLLDCQMLVCTADFVNSSPYSINAQEILQISQQEIDKISLLKNPQQALAVFYQPTYNIEESNLSSKLALVLDGIQDPGNMGTIVRLADWYGINDIYCSQDTADIYNPKTVQATMGAIARVKVHYTDIESLLARHTNIPVYGTFLEGEDMYTKELTANGLIVMGNEGNGIRPNISRLINEKLYIPPYPRGEQTSESLNVAVATAIICAEFRRRTF